MIHTRFGALAALAAAALVVTGCMLVPGKFASELELHRDGRFTYRYDGEIYLLAMSQLSEAANAIGDDGETEFIEQPCFDGDEWDYLDEAAAEAEEAMEWQDTDAEPEQDVDDPDTVIVVVDPDGDDENESESGIVERECTAEELADQREAYDSRMERKRRQAEQQAQMMNLFFGGLDPTDPDAADELVARLKRQRGWERVEYKGDGLFDVSFSITATMGHDFVFPTFERFPLNNFILTAAIREPGTVRIDAPGFAVQGGTGPMGGMMSGLVGAMQIFEDDEEAEDMPRFPELEGTFTIVTDGRILANNTDEGPSEVSGMQRLEWEITPRTQSAPMALIALD